MSILENQIKEYYIVKDNTLRIEQGDLLKDVPISQIISENKDTIETIDIVFHHMLVISQDCDLEQFFGAQERDKIHMNQYLHNVILLPCFYRDEIERGTCSDFVGIEQDALSKKQIDKIKKDEILRYQYIRDNNPLAIPELFIDFKAYYTLSPNYLYGMYKNRYMATINALFRERITQRYANYISRIGLPNL